MSDLKELMGLNFAEIIFGIILILVCFKYLSELMDWVIKKIRNRFKKTETLESDHDLLTKHNEELKQQKEQIDKIVTSVEAITTKLDEMKKQDDDSSRRQLKEKIANAYRLYHEKGEWTAMEKEAFEGLIEDYESHGGKNSFVHDICQPESYTWNII